MIKINKIEFEEYVILRDSTYFGMVSNILELNDLRIQIAKEKANDFSILFEGKEVPIGDNGKINNWPYGLYDLEMAQMAELFRTQREQKEDKTLHTE